MEKIGSLLLHVGSVFGENKIQQIMRNFFYEPDTCVLQKVLHALRVYR